MSNYSLEDYKQALYSLKTDIGFRMETDLDFLKEIKEHLCFYQERKDPTRFELAKDMINDWISELERKVKEDK